MIHAETLQPSVIAAPTSTRRPRRILRRVGAVAAGPIALAASALPSAWLGGRLHHRR